MKIKTKDIPKEGLEIKETVTADELGFAIEDLKVLTPLKVVGEIEKTRSSVSAQVEVAGKYEFLCARCLEPVTKQRKDEFDIHVEIEPTDDVVDLGEEIRQELVVSLSPIVLCKEDCKGICPSCGANLNKEKCKCKK
ncbi:MAG: DUF177 domain-containing protein [Candidatus Omnitrophica bacterium]|nr:DUF177 domain-containing protein [Candidatus Omnitrophota bacterium]